jgi:type III restriction enzyme
MAFVAGWLGELLLQPGFDLARANLQKFLLRNLLDAHIKALRRDAVQQAYQQTLFADGNAERVVVDSQFTYDFRPDAYAPSRDDDHAYGRHEFRKHFYSRIGAFDSKEEFECAVWLDIQAQKGRLQFWVRNLARREGASFYLQKATGRFYPDFICKRLDGTVLVVEYKGENGWKNAEDDRQIGGLWQAMSGGSCWFVMVANRQWDAIEPLLG